MSRTLLALLPWLALPLIACQHETELHTPTTPAGPTPPGTTDPTEPTEPTDPTDPTTPAASSPFGRISWFQVVEVPALVDDQPVAPAARNAPLIADREVLLRVFVDEPDQLRPGVEAQLVVTAADGTDHAVSSTGSDPQQGFLVPLDGTWVQPGATWHVTVGDHRYPEAGGAELAPEETGPIDIHVVPFEIAGFVPDTSAAVIQGMADAVYAVYPTTEVRITVGDVVLDAYGGGGLTPETFDDLLVRVGILQETLGQPNEYWVGLVTGAATRAEYCADCPTGTSEDGGGFTDRAYFALAAAFGDQTSEDTLIHELGHTHQLTHAPCGGAGDTDPAFPYAGGTIGVEGYDVRTGELVPADHFDMMGYCYPRWISDHNYAQLVSQVQFAQGW